jgi:hypothetical protein
VTSNKVQREHGALRAGKYFVCVSKKLSELENTLSADMLVDRKACTKLES